MGIKEETSFQGLQMSKRKLRECYEQLNADTFYNADATDKFFKDELLKQTQETTDNVNHPVSIKEIQCLDKNLPLNMISRINSTKHIRKN